MFSPRTFVTCAAICLIPKDGFAINHTEGTLAGECAWASVVSVGDVCTGTLITPDHVMIAAHCSAFATAAFGEVDLEGSGPEVTVDLENCLPHQNFSNPGTYGLGPDLSICEVATETPAPDVPTIPQMEPTGPARDWLRELVYAEPWTVEDSEALVTVVGAGCNEGSDTDNCWGDQGWKYEFDPAVTDKTVLRRQTTVAQSPTKLHLATNSDAVIKAGDSGGPTFVQFRDGSWRQIGVHHSDTIYDEATPPYLAWIEENVVPHDVTPCHSLYDSEWVWTGDCSGEFPTNPGASYDTWDNDDCTGVSYGGGLNPFGTSTEELPILANQGQPFSGEGLPWASIAEFDELYPTALSMAGSGGFGEIPQKADIAEWFVDEIFPNSVSPFLGTVKRAGIE